MKLTFALLLLTLSGCQSYLALVEGLNERQVQSCLEYNGAANLGGAGIGASSGALHGITATGGANLETCVELLR